MQQKVERLQAQLRDLKGKSSDIPSASNTLDPLNQKLESKIVELKFQVVNYEREISHIKTTYKNQFDSIRAHAKLHDLIFENAKLRARLFENTSESINPSQTPKVDLVPNKQSSASIRTNPITNSQRHVIVKENVSSNMATASSTGLVHTARTRRPQPKGNTRNAKVLSASKKVAFRRNTCFIRDLDGVDFLKGNHSTNLYTINLYDMALASPICLMAYATPTKS
nr:integrase, catalytic region, zinc finger, CCHC-type, peptidase aspartic, catalytic [Tanacetum cinerariifolium]